MTVEDATQLNQLAYTSNDFDGSAYMSYAVRKDLQGNVLDDPYVLP